MSHNVTDCTDKLNQIYLKNMYTTLLNTLNKISENLSQIVKQYTFYHKNSNAYE